MIEILTSLNLSLFHISLYDLASLASLFVGLAFALLLAFAKRSGNAANLFLGVALVVIVLKTAGLTQLLMPALGPLMYLYVRKLTTPESRFRWKDTLHFSLLLVGYWTPAWLVPVSVIIYLYLAHRLMEDFYHRMKPVLMDRPRFAFRRLNKMLMLLGLLCVLSLFYDIFLLGVAFIIIGIAAQTILNPDGDVRLVTPITDRSDAREKGRRLKEAVAVNRLYEDAELTLTTLAVKLNIHPHELSRIINIGLEKNFSDFINEFRVREIARRMQDPAYDRYTLPGIAYTSGFNSKTTFNRVFREMTGKTPLEYKNAYKKEVPIDKLAHLQQIRPVILHPESPPTRATGKLNRNIMFKNYLKIAWRNMLHNKVYSALNITGLAAGMAVALLIGLWVFHQYSYDRFLPNYGQVYQVKFNFTDPKDGTHTQPDVCLPLATVLRNTIPGVKRVSETSKVGNSTRNLKVGDKKLLIQSGDVSPDFLKILQYPFVKGDPNTALKDVYSIVIDESTAKALFGDADPMDKTIRVDNQHDVKVTGVIKDIPATASIKFGCLLPFSYKQLTESWMKNASTQWDNNSFEMWTELQPGVTQEQVAPKIKVLLVKYHPSYKNVKGEVILHAMKDWHLYSDFKNGKISGGFIDYVRMFSVIGALVLLIACINFMNLSTARSEKRAREVGVRKAIGSQRRDLIFQFLTESLMITFAAFLFSILLVQLALAPFNALTGGSVRIPYDNPVFWAIMIGYVVLTGLLAGSRPAFYLSSFNAVKVLKGTIQIGRAASLPRKILVVLQFSCSVALIISTVIIYQQIQYVKDRPVGYSPDRLVSTAMSNDLAHGYDALKNDLLQSRVVESVTKASSPLTTVDWYTGIDRWPGQNPGDLGINVGGVSVADNYFKTVGIKLLAGHDFSPDFAADTASVIINETAVKRMGLKQPLDQLIDYGGSKRQRIIGVAQDALMVSPFTPVEPMIFNHAWRGNFVIYRLAAGSNPHEAMVKIKKIFDKYNPAFPFEYTFVDKAYDQKFNLEMLIGKLAGIFAALAIFISCLGLFGLAAYVAEQRTKEIGIRKVLGASIGNVWMLLSKDFIVLVVISCLIASPLALYFLKPWLAQYQYRISIGPGVFFLSAMAALLITVLTVSFQAVKAAIANPVKSLRSE